MRGDGRERTTVLELAILGLLKEQELHGYELKKRLSDTLGFASGVSFGSLYPALGRLEAAGAVKAVEAFAPARAAIPLTGSLGGELAAFRARTGVTRGSRGKKVYGITPQGEARFEELLAVDARPVDDDRLFSLRLAFARYLPADVRLGLLERRRALLGERLARLTARIRAGRDRLDGYATTLIEHDREMTERDISWIERLIAAERGAPSAGAAAAPGAAGPVSDGAAGPVSDGAAGPVSDGAAGPVSDGAAGPVSGGVADPAFPMEVQHP
jgi:DNA-binding PadR family transcriptional regulator